MGDSKTSKILRKLLVSVAIVFSDGSVCTKSQRKTITLQLHNTPCFLAPNLPRKNIFIFVQVRNRTTVKPFTGPSPFPQIVSRISEDQLPNYLLEWKPKHGKRSRLKRRPRKILNDVFIEDSEQ